MLKHTAWLKTRDGQKAMEALRQGDEYDAVAKRFRMPAAYVKAASVLGAALPDKILEAVKLYRDNMAIRAILELTGIHTMALYRALALLGMPTRLGRKRAPRRWCSWCGETLPKGLRRRTCNERCAYEIGADTARRTNRARKEAELCA